MDPMVLTGTGVWSAGLRYGDRGQARDAAAELEELGYSAAWLPDVGGNLFEVIDDLLDATGRMVVATGILNLWFHEPAVAADRFHAAVAAHGPRLLIGLAVANLADDHAVQLALPLDADGGEVLDTALDAVRDKFGSSAITRAATLRHRHHESVPILSE